MSLTIALVAGEDSGDQLGAALINALKKRYPDCRFVGIGGERMRSKGMDCWWDCSELAIFGLFEVFNHLVRIWSLRKDLTRRLKDLKPDVFIGIDAPDFNLGLEKKLRRAGITTVHYVSPTVWAWRAWRTKKIRQSADLVLCLFPFEPGFLADHGIRAAFVGHPMASQIEAVDGTAEARERLGIDSDFPGNHPGPVFALLPGSRSGEVERLSGPMLGAARLLSAKFPNAVFVAAIANTRAGEVFNSHAAEPGMPAINSIMGRVRDVIASADVVICASGTVTLETLLVNRPMVVIYRLAVSTYRLARMTGLVKSRFISLPNILASERLVPELIQDEASPENIAGEASSWLNDEARREQVRARFEQIHATLEGDASERAAEEITALLTRAS